MAEIRWWWQPPYTENLEEQAQKERFVQAQQITDALEANPGIANNLNKKPLLTWTLKFAIKLPILEQHMYMP